MQTDPEAVYANAPRIMSEICWVLATARTAPYRAPELREFWLRKAALLDRIALREVAEFAPEVAAGAVEAAVLAARRLVEHDVTFSDLSLRGAGLSFDEDYRAYVREEYGSRFGDQQS